MAKSPQGYNVNNVKRWFGTLNLREQNALARDLMDVVNAAKASRINELEAELAELKGTPRSMPASSAKAPVKSAPAAKPTKSSGSPLAGVKVPAKYADKAGHSWSGRGIHPRWLRDALVKGKKLEDFLISKGKTKS